MEIVKVEDLSKTQVFANSRNSILLKWIMQGAKLNQLNALYKAQYSQNPDVFIENIFDVLNITPSYFDKELERIPEKGPFMAYGNHPLGILDGLLFIYLLRKRRLDIKILANDMLSRVEPLKDLLIPVDLFGEDAKTKNVGGIKSMYSHIRTGGGVLVFPAGEVSTIKDGRVQDKFWRKSVTKLMLKSNIPLIPVFFDGINSRGFHFKGRIHPSLRTLSLAHEMYQKKGSELKVRIGKPIKNEYLDSLANLTEKQLYLRAKIYGLSNLKQASITELLMEKVRVKPSKISEASNSELFKLEIESLKKEQKILEKGDFQLFMAKQSECPFIIDEIGRLREITFRQVGEGTGKSSDLDIFDSYYHHLFIWNKVENSIVGSYRVGFGQDIISEFGKSGFYTHKLFKYKKELKPVLERSIELGRSFIREEYQKHPLTLLLLWQGILELLVKNENYRYLLGAVSISNNFSTISKEIMIQYLQSQFFDFEKAKYVKPRKPYKIKFKEISETLLKEKQDSLKDVDNLIEELEPFGLKIPVLLKKYLGQNGRLIGFNTDPNFNYCLDGLILLDFALIPTQTIRKFSKTNTYEVLQRQNAFYFENINQY